MTEKRPALVLHLVGTAHPVHIALAAAEAESLNDRLAGLLGSGEAKLLATADGGRIAVNFAHVATAHLEDVRSDAHAYGAPARETGFGS